MRDAALPSTASTPDWPAALQALADRGAAERAPLEWHFVTLLAQRLSGEHEAVRARLAARLSRALAELEARLEAPVDLTTLAATTDSPLRALLGDMDAAPAPSAPMAPATAARAGRAAPPLAAATPRPELKSVGRMRKTLSRLKVRQQVSQALAQPPQHAGPINSQMLVLRSLALMQDISPEYLHRFMSHVDALMTLEDAQRLPAPSQAPAKTGKAPSKAAGKSAKR